MKLPSLLAALALTLLFSCSVGTRQLLPMPSQAVAVSDPGLCRIYVARTHEARGAIRKVTVFDGDQEVGTIARDDFLCWERQPVRGLLTMVYEGGALNADYESLFDLQPEPGGVYYVAVTIDPKSDNPQDTSLRKPHARLLDLEEGRQLIADRSPAN